MTFISIPGFKPNTKDKTLLYNRKYEYQSILSLSLEIESERLNVINIKLIRKSHLI